MANEKLNDALSLYSEEIALLNQSLEETELLYHDTETHLNELKESRQRGSLTFIEKQTSNLVALKNTKLSIIKEMISVKKLAIDLNKKDEAGSTNTEIVNELYKKIFHMDKTEDEEEYEDNEEINVFKKSKKEDVDNDLDKKLAELEKDNKIEFCDNDLDIIGKTGYKDESNNTILAIALRDKKWRFVMINEMGIIVKDNLKSPNKKDYKMKLTKIDGELFGKDQNDKLYMVIKE